MKTLSLGILVALVALGAFAALGCGARSTRHADLGGALGPDGGALSDGASGSDAASGDAPHADMVSAHAPPPLPAGAVAEPAGGTGACGSPLGSIGGGAGYARTIDRRAATVVVSDRASLLAALARAHAGDVLYVDDGANIDLDGAAYTAIPGGVTLASGRGVNGSPGARLFDNDIANDYPLFVVGGDNVRVTGLRIQGPFCDVGDNVDGPHLNPPHDSRAIHTYGHTNLEVDNNEISCWTIAGVQVDAPAHAFIHNNYVHHDQRAGVGYGVVLGGAASALIEGNSFDYCRHAIAGNGDRGERYEARYNHVGANATEPSFDMHGEAETHPNLPSSPYAGNRVVVHHNSFDLVSWSAVCIRGRPYDGAYVDHNAFKLSALLYADPADNGRYYAVWQRLNFGNLVVSAFNLLASAASCPGPGHWEWCAGGGGNWARLGASSVSMRDVLWGDFDGDHKMDAFRADGTTWSVAAGGAPPWLHANDWVPLAVSDLALGDFDGDGRSDVFYADGTRWRVSYGGTTPFVQINLDNHQTSDLALADFDGDGKTDVFMADGSHWFIARGGVGPWQQVNGSDTLVRDMLFGDFNGDRRADVFFADGASWHVSYGATSSWDTINTASEKKPDLAVGDFNGDGSADVFTGDGAHWKVSWGGRHAWVAINAADNRVIDLGFADVNGDGKTDVLHAAN